MKRLAVLILIITAIYISPVANAQSKVFGVDTEKQKINLCINNKGDYIEKDNNSVYFKDGINDLEDGLKIDKKIDNTAIKTHYRV